MRERTLQKQKDAHELARALCRMKGEDAREEALRFVQTVWARGHMANRDQADVVEMAIQQCGGHIPP